MITNNISQTNEIHTTAEQCNDITPKSNPTHEIARDSFLTYNRDGDTLELTTKMTDANLARCSKEKLMQLLSSKKITRQQYDKAIKSHK